MKLNILFYFTIPTFVNIQAWKFKTVPFGTSVNPLTPRSNYNMTSLNKINTLTSKQVINNTQTYQVEIVILFQQQSLVTNLQGIV